MGMKAGGDDELNAEINVTPLVDVMLVLLIIFMITAPMMNTGIVVELPPVVADAPEDPNGPLVLGIKADQSLWLGKTQITWKELQAKIKANELVQREKKLFIAGDTHLAYGIVATAMAMAKKAGVEHVLLLTNPSDELKPDDLDQIAKH